MNLYEYLYPFIGENMFFKNTMVGKEVSFFIHTYKKAFTLKNMTGVLGVLLPTGCRW